MGTNWWAIDNLVTAIGLISSRFTFRLYHLQYILTNFSVFFKNPKTKKKQLKWGLFNLTIQEKRYHVCGGMLYWWVNCDVHQLLNQSKNLKHINTSTGTKITNAFKLEDCHAAFSTRHSKAIEKCKRCNSASSEFFPNAICPISPACLLNFCIAKANDDCCTGYFIFTIRINRFQPHTLLLFTVHFNGRQKADRDPSFTTVWFCV